MCKIETKCCFKYNVQSIAESQMTTMCKNETTCMLLIKTVGRQITTIDTLSYPKYREDSKTSKYETQKMTVSNNFSHLHISTSHHFTIVGLEINQLIF